MQLPVSKESPRHIRSATKPRPVPWISSGKHTNTVDGSRLLSPDSSDRTTSPSRQNVTLPRSSSSRLEPLEVQKREPANTLMETARRIDTPRKEEQGDTKEITIEAGIACLLSPGLSDITSDRTTSPNRQKAALPSSPSLVELLHVQNREHESDDPDGSMKTASRMDTPKRQEQCETKGMEVEEIRITDTRPLINQELEHTPTDENPATFTEHLVNLFDVGSVRRDHAIEEAGSGNTSDYNAPTGQQLPSDTPKQLTQADDNQRDDGQTFDTLEENIRLQVCCMEMETTIKQQRQEIARQGQLLNSYQKGVRYKEQEIMDGLIKTIEHLNQELEDHSNIATSTKLRHDSELKQLLDRLERAEKTIEELRDHLETQRNDYHLLEQSTSETEKQLHSFQNPLTIRRDTIKPTTEELGVGSHGGIYCMYIGTLIN